MITQAFHQAFDATRPTLNKLPLSGQKQFVKLMLDVIARALVAASKTDEHIQTELAGYPAGTTVQMKVLPNVAEFTLRVTDAHTFERVKLQGEKPSLSIQFKHVRLAYLVLSLQEGTARAYANDRMVADGDLADAVRFVRCLNRLEAVILPKAVASLAVKSYPKLTLKEKLSTAAKVYAGTIKSLVT